MVMLVIFVDSPFMGITDQIIYKSNLQKQYKYSSYDDKYI